MKRDLDVDALAECKRQLLVEAEDIEGFIKTIREDLEKKTEWEGMLVYVVARKAMTQATRRTRRCSSHSYTIGSFRMVTSITGPAFGRTQHSSLIV